MKFAIVRIEHRGGSDQNSITDVPLITKRKRERERERERERLSCETLLMHSYTITNSTSVSLLVNFVAVSGR